MPLALGLEEVLGANPDPEVITKLYKKCKPNHFVAAPTNILQIIDAMKRIYMTQGEDGTLYKIFPARTEMVLMELENVKKCAVTVRMEGKLVKEQVAYLVLNKKTEKENVLDKVRTHCRKMLPSHSIPGKYIILDEIPFTQSGKTDYRALEKMKVK